MKKILVTVFIVLAVLAAAAYFLLSNLDSIARNIIEDTGSEVLGTRVSTESVSIRLREGSAAISNLSVANPPGFSDQPAFRFSEITAVVDIVSGVVKRIHTSEPQIRVEFKGNRSNFEVLNKNIQASAASGEKNAKQEEEMKKDPDRDPVQIQIDEVEVEKAKATVTWDDGGEPVELTIDRLRFGNLNGSPQQIARVMLGQFVAQVLAETARRTLKKKAQEYIGEKQDALKDELGKKLEKLLN
jgi:hypothetical protein